jgi:hypothetical protein
VSCQNKKGKNLFFQVFFGTGVIGDEFVTTFADISYLLSNQFNNEEHRGRLLAIVDEAEEALDRKARAALKHRAEADCALCRQAAWSRSTANGKAEQVRNLMNEVFLGNSFDKRKEQGARSWPCVCVWRVSLSS